MKQTATSLPAGHASTWIGSRAKPVSQSRLFWLPAPALGNDKFPTRAITRMKMIAILKTFAIDCRIQPSALAATNI